MGGCKITTTRTGDCHRAAEHRALGFNGFSRNVIRYRPHPLESILRCTLILACLEATATADTYRRRLAKFGELEFKGFGEKATADARVPVSAL